MMKTHKARGRGGVARVTVVTVKPIRKTKRPLAASPKGARKENSK
jgi:hypothetical protein